MRKRTIGVLAVVLVLATSSGETPLPISDTRDSRAVAWDFFTAVLNHEPEAALRYTDGSIDLDPVTKVSDFMRQQEARTTGGPVFIRSPVWSRGPEWQFELAVTQPGIDRQSDRSSWRAWRATPVVGPLPTGATWRQFPFQRRSRPRLKASR